MRYEQLETIAVIAHNAVTDWSRAHGDAAVRWDDAPEWQRISMLNGVRRALQGQTPEQLHESWMADKVTDDWTWGPVKDPERKTHPCLVGYEALPAYQRTKDDLFHAIVHALAPDA